VGYFLNFAFLFPSLFPPGLPMPQSPLKKFATFCRRLIGKRDLLADMDEAIAASEAVAPLSAPARQAIAQFAPVLSGLWANGPKSGQSPSEMLKQKMIIFGAAEREWDKVMNRAQIVFAHAETEPAPPNHTEAWIVLRAGRTLWLGRPHWRFGGSIEEYQAVFEPHQKTIAEIVSLLSAMPPAPWMGQLAAVLEQQELSIDLADGRSLAKPLVAAPSLARGKRL